MSTSTTARSLIAAMQVTLDGRILGPEGEVDWVDSWADGLELLPPVDAFVLGGGMIGGYEQFWAAVLDDPAAIADMLGRDPYPRELAYARVAAVTPHLVLSTTLTETTWPSARLVRDIGEIRALREQPGRPVYVVGGPGAGREPDRRGPARRAPPDRAPGPRRSGDALLQRAARRARTRRGPAHGVRPGPAHVPPQRPCVTRR